MNETFEQYITILNFMKEFLPDIYDVILVDCSSKEFPIVEQSNWSSPNSDIMRDKLIKAFKKHKSKKDFPEMEQEIGLNKNQMLRFFYLYIKEEDAIIGAMVVCMETEVLTKSIMLLKSMLGDEIFPFTEKTDLVELSDIKNIVASYLSETDEISIHEKREIFVDLYDAGVFRLKGAIGEVAKELHMSEKSAYRYLAEIRKARQ